MTIACVYGVDKWPPADKLPLEVLRDDGQVARMFARNGRGEVTLIGPMITGPIPEGSKWTHTVIPLDFATLDQAERAGRVLADAFDVVRRIQAEDAPDPDTCEHVSKPRYFARDITRHLVCEKCATYLGTVSR